MKEHDIVLDKAYFGYSIYKPEEMEDFIEEMKKGIHFKMWTSPRLAR